MIIKKLKEKLGISKEVETQTFLLEKKNIDCTIDDVKINCEELEAPIHEFGPSHFSHEYSPYGIIPSENRYTGVPAPAYLQDDPWFGPAPNLSENQQDYMKQETEFKKQEEEHKEELRSSGHTVEDENIHQKMYEIASKNWTTVGETQGGSENFHEGPGGWCSGNGYNQFRNE